MLYLAVPILGGVWIIWKPFKDEVEDLQKATNLVAWFIAVMGTVTLVALMATMHFVAYSGGQSHPLFILLSGWGSWNGLCIWGALEGWVGCWIIITVVLYLLFYSLLFLVTLWFMLSLLPVCWCVFSFADNPRDRMEREDKLLSEWGR
jgi:hypothetical protein